MNKKYFIMILFLMVFIFIPIQKVSGFEIEGQNICSYIVDGDTIDIDNGYRLRFADVNTPEVGEQGYQEAKDYIIDLCLNKIIYIDYDDMGSMSYGRYIVVIYVQYNSTYLLNINKALLVYGYAEIMDFYNNEFNPATWNLYEYYFEVSPNPDPIPNIDNNKISGYNIFIIFNVIVILTIFITRYKKYNE